MARITVEDCLEKLGNQFEVVQVAAHRARQLEIGMPAKVPEDGDRSTVIALREIAEGFITKEVLDEPINEFKDADSELSHLLRAGEPGPTIGDPLPDDETDEADDDEVALTPDGETALTPDGETALTPDGEVALTSDDDKAVLATAGGAALATGDGGAVLATNDDEPPLATAGESALMPDAGENAPAPDDDRQDDTAQQPAEE